MTWKYILVANNVPLDSMLKQDLGRAVERAQGWAEHLRTTVGVLRINNTDVELVMYVDPPQPESRS